MHPHSNTSHVTINRPGIEFLTLLVKIQIHLMLLLIMVRCRGTCLLHVIQIHLMLLLINLLYSMQKQTEYSNTSHVTINQEILYQGRMA